MADPITDQTSLVAEALAVEGSALQILAGSPAAYKTICNITSVALPISTKTITVTNIGDTWERNFPTLLTMGKISFDVEFVPTEPTHSNTAAAGSAPAGLRWLQIHRTKATFKLVYSDGSGTSDSFPAFVVGFELTGKVGDSWKAKLSLSNSGAPTLA